MLSAMAPTSERFREDRPGSRVFPGAEQDGGESGPAGSSPQPEGCPYIIYCADESFEVC